MPLRPVSFYLPSSSEIKIFFSDTLAELSVSNFSIKTLTGSSPEVEIKSITINSNNVILKTSPQNPRTYYLLTLNSSNDLPFRSKGGEFLIDDKISRSIYFVGSEEYNPIRDRVFANVPSIYSLQGSRIEDVLSIHSKALHEAQRSAGELLSDGFLRVPIKDEVRTRSGASFDRLANENVFRINRVSKNITGALPLEKTLDYSSGNSISRHDSISDIISLQEVYRSEKILVTKENMLSESFLLELDKDVIKLLSLKLVKKNEEPDCDGNLGTFLDINKYGYLIKDPRYDSLSKAYFNLSSKSIILPPLSNLGKISVGDEISLEYLYKDSSINPLDEFEAYEVIINHKESVPTNSKAFSLSNSNLVSLTGSVADIGLISFFKNENSSEVPEEFRFEIKHGSRTPNKPGEYSVDYESGVVNVYGIDGSGTGDLTYICKYNYKRVLDDGIDYYIYNKEFVLNKSRSVINNDIYIKFNYENIFSEGIHYEDLTHKEVHFEKVGNKLESSFSIKTNKGPVSSIFKIINKTTGEIYNPLYSIKNRIYFSGFRSPEIKSIEGEPASFNSVFSEKLFHTAVAICPSFSGTITNPVSPSKIEISPPIPSDLIDSSSLDYYLRIKSENKDVKIKFFSGGSMISSIGIEGSYVPPSGVSFEIGTKLAIIDLKKSEVLSKSLQSIGSIFDSSLEFADKSIFKNEKFFNLSEPITYSEKQDNLYYLKSINSGNIRENLMKIRRVGDYGVDYKNGVVYLAIKNSQEDSFGTVSYRHNHINPQNSNIISVNDIKILNTITNNEYKFTGNSHSETHLEVGGLGSSYEEYASNSVFYNNSYDETCIVLSDYTILVSKDIFKLNSMFLRDDVYGKNIYVNTEDRSKDISSSSIESLNILKNKSFDFHQNKIDLKTSKRLYSEKSGSKSVITLFLKDEDKSKASSFNLYNIVDNNSGKIVSDGSLINRKSEVFYSSVTNKSGSFILNVLNEEVFDLISLSDFVIDEDKNKYSIVSYSKISKTIELSGSTSSLVFYLSSLGTISK